MTSAVEIAGLRVTRGGHVMLAGVDLTIGEREVVALAGPSGAGKTTLLRVVLGLERPDAGSVRLGDRVASENERVMLAPEDRGIGVVFQELALWPHMTVHGNLAFTLSSLEPADRDARIDAMLRRVGLADKARRFPGQLSGGERQRVAIARALVAQPQLVALDEPLANLDVVLAEELLALFGELLRERGVAALYITHAPIEAELADRVIVLEAGRVVQTGTLDELRTTPGSPFVERFAHRARSARRARDEKLA